MNQDSRALTESEIEKIQHNIFNGLYNDWELTKLFITIQIQRNVLRQLFNLFTTEPMRLVSTSDPIRNSNLTHLKELVSIEDGR